MLYFAKEVNADLISQNDRDLAYIESVYVPSTPTPVPRVVPRWTHCSCVNVAKSLTGYDKIVGAAKNWPVNSDKPVVGGVVITKESYYGHVAQIIEVREDSIILREGNFKPCQFTNGRELKLDNTKILGFWNPDL